MSHAVQSFFSGAIIQTLVTAIIIGAVSLILDDKFKEIKENAKVSRETQIATVKLNVELPRVIKALDGLSNKIESLFEHQIEHEKAVPVYKVWKTKVDLKLEAHKEQIKEHQLGLEMIDIKCSTNERNIEKCRYTLKKDGSNEF